MREHIPKYPSISLVGYGENGNTFFLLANAVKYLKQLEESKEDINQLKKDVFASHSYEEALSRIQKYFWINFDDGDSITDDENPLTEELINLVEGE